MAVDKILEMQRQAAEAEAARKKAATDADALRQLQEQERLARERQKAEERRQLVRSVTDRVLKQSGVLSELRDIESRLLQGVERHGIVVDLDNADVRLVWGNRFNISPEGKIERRKIHFAKRGFLSNLTSESLDDILEYSYIGVSVDVDSESLKIGGYDTLSPVEWRNKARLSESLAKVYLNPQREHRDYSPPSSSSSNGECCCN
jgi:hypothetical protein